MGLLQHVKEHRRKPLFRSDNAKDIKKFPFQSIGIEKGMIWERIGKMVLFSLQLFLNFYI